MLISNNDTHSIRNDTLGLKAGDRVVVNGNVFTCTWASKSQACFKGQGFSIPGASSKTPVKVEVLLEGEASTSTEGEASASPEEAELFAALAEAKKAAAAIQAAANKEARLANLRRQLEEAKEQLAALQAAK